MLRKARIEDVKKIYVLISQFAKQNLMLGRSFNELYENVRDFWIYAEGNKIIGCCALHVVWSELSEIKSLAVAKRYQSKGIGTKLVNSCIVEAKGLGARKIFVLTFKPDYFKRFGFRRIKKDNLPHKIWVECIRCSKFPDCKEIAMIKDI